MKKHIFLILFLFLSIVAHANVSIGQAYKISSAASSGSSIFVRNASLANDADAVLWVETNVPAQRWIFTLNSDNSYTITNAYSRKALYRKGNAVDGALITQSDNSAANASKWTLTEVPNQAGQYYITQTHRDGNEELYLETPTAGNGVSLELRAQKTGADAQKQIWDLELAGISTEFLQSTRDEMMAGWKAKYYKKAPTGYVLGNGGWWGDAEMFEVVLDAYETTGDAVHETMFRELYKNFIVRNRTSWLYNEFNDDIAWMVIVSVRGYLMFGDAAYLTNAKTNFDQMYARALLPSGMLRWKETQETENGTNSCINGPAEVAACYLAIALGDDSYYEKAKSLYALQRKYLYVPSTGQVYDSFSWVDGKPSNYNHWASTYNQGTYLGAAVMLYNRYGGKMYKDDAEMIMKYTAQNLCDENGIIKVCQVGGGDLAGFKGILMRYVRRFIVDFQKTEYVDWMRKNALHAYNNRNTTGVTSSAWLTKTPENFILNNCNDKCDFNNDPFGPSTAVSVVFNAPLDENRIVKNAFSTIQAEHFDYLKGIHVQAGSNGNDYEIGNIKDGFYVAYNNVDFGNSLASSIEIKVSKASVRSSIQVRQGSPTGALIGTVSIPTSGNDWQTLTENISQVSGMQNIYLVFTGVAGQSNIFKIDSFRFKTETYVFSDITDNGGLLTASVETTDMNNAIDNFLNTNATFSENSAFWLQYESPAPVALQAYAIFSNNASADKDPKSWKLQASNDGENWTDLDGQNNQQFTARYQKKVHTVSTSNVYTFFRLNVSLNNGNANETQFADWQLYGNSIFDEDITADGGVLSAQYNGNESDETYVKLTDKSVSTKYLVMNETDLWIQYQANGIYKLKSYSLTSANDASDRDPKSWTLYASNDGTNWTKTDSRQNQLFNYRNSTQYYNAKADEGFQYYRLHITANNGASMTQIAEWQLSGDFYYDYLYNDITMNGGELSSSGNSTAEKLKALTDNNGNTKYMLDFSSSAWIQYQSSIPATVLAYSVIAGFDSDKDPRNWTLQGSNDGQNWMNIHTRSNITFSQRGERKTYTLSTTAKYTYFRMNITRLSNTNSTEVIIGEWELHGTGISSTDITGNGGTVSAELLDRNTSEGVLKLIDKAESSKYCNTFYGSLWVSYQSPVPVKISAYSITSANDEESRDPRAWTIEASTNGADWELIDSRSKQDFPYRGITQYYACNKDLKEYSYFRLNITENKGANLMQFAEWQLLDIDWAGGEPNKVDEIKFDEISIYPNPVQDLLYIDMPEKGIARIFNLSGQMIYNNRLSEGLQTLQMGDFEQGFYLMSLQIGNSLVTKKIIKK